VRVLPSAKALHTPVVTDHIPRLLDEMVAMLRDKGTKITSDSPTPASAPEHGLQRADHDFDLAEVVAEYGILRHCLHDLAEESGVILQGAVLNVINQIMDGAIAGAINAYVMRRGVQLKRQQEQHLSFLAHDLRTPLNAIALAADVLERSLPSPVAHEPVLKALTRNIVHLKELIESVLNENVNVLTEIGVRVEKLELELRSMIDSLIDDLTPLAVDVQLLNEVPDRLIVNADAALLQRIFQNLVGNSLKHTREGTISIGAERKPGESLVRCWVSDTGEGIAPVQLARVVAGTRDKSKSPGQSGLGLEIVRTFTEALGGTVTIKSKQFEGTCVLFTLPDAEG
jgi:signal transduction histidine kinase